MDLKTWSFISKHWGSEHIVQYSNRGLYLMYIVYTVSNPVIFYRAVKTTWALCHRSSLYVVKLYGSTGPFRFATAVCCGSHNRIRPVFSGTLCWRKLGLITKDIRYNWTLSFSPMAPEPFPNSLFVVSSLDLIWEALFIQLHKLSEKLRWIADTMQYQEMGYMHTTDFIPIGRRP